MGSRLKKRQNRPISCMSADIPTSGTVTDFTGNIVVGRYKCRSVSGFSSANGDSPVYFASAVILRLALGMAARPGAATLYGRIGSLALSKPRQVAIGRDPRRKVTHIIG